MSNTFLVDVIVINYNGGAYLQRCVDSVLKSDIPLHLIVVDNCSTDSSMRDVKTLDHQQHKLNFIENTTNLGFAKAVNQAAKQGDSDCLFLLNPDCEIYPHTLRNLVAELADRPAAGVLGALVFNEDGSEQRGCRRLEPTFARSVVTALRLDKYFTSVNLQHSPLPSAVEAIDAVSGSAMLIRRPTFEVLEGMDEGYFLHVEDLDFCRRVREAGEEVAFTPNVSLFHCQGVSTRKVPYTMEWYKHEGMLRYHSKYQKPNQNAVRSTVSRGVIYLNYLLSIARHGPRRPPKGPNEQAPVRLTAGHDGKIVITGASSDLGKAVLTTMSGEELPIIAVTRKKIPKTKVANEIWFNWGFFEKVPAQDLGLIDQWMAFSPVWSAPVIAQVLSRQNSPRRSVVFSSTSIDGKRHSDNKRERELVDALKQGEQELLVWAKKDGANLTIARASMIYGGLKNKNINLLKQIVKVFRCFPLLADGKGMRQPVHVDDLATATHQIRIAKTLPRNTYVLAGGELLSYKEMLERVFTAVNIKPRFINVPVNPMKLVALMLGKVPGLGFVNSALINRMTDDLSYDIDDAKVDFGYAPGKFRP